MKSEPDLREIECIKRSPIIRSTLEILGSNGPSSKRNLSKNTGFSMAKMDVALKKMKRRFMIKPTPNLLDMRAVFYVINLENSLVREILAEIEQDE